jgi:cytochrome c peroxidase
MFTFAVQPKPDSTRYVQSTLDFINNHASLFAASSQKLQTAISKIKQNDSLSLVNAKEALKNCRAQYKTIEFFITYFFRSNSLVYNEPPNYEVEEPYFDYRSPTGFQVIEAILFSKEPLEQKKDLKEQSALLYSSASDIHAFLYNLKINDKQILESIRLGLIRIITLGITGYDAPELKTGVSESGDALLAFKNILQPLLRENTTEADSVSFYFNEALKLILENHDFNSFDRLSFLTNTMFPLQRHLGLLIKKQNLEINTTGVLNYNAKNLFSANALFIDPKSNPYNLPIFPTDTNAIKIALNVDAKEAVISLGKKLFFEKALSGNCTRSCGSCHQPENYYTDGLSKALRLNGTGTVKRNTPTLFYVDYQYSQFLDGRATSLENQIGIVLKNPNEMNADLAIVLERLKNNKQYVAAFSKAFPDAKKDSIITIAHLALSISDFLKTLAPFSSAFDRYMMGERWELTLEQKRGFNLFMGKAECATCHFAPVFNGLLPPFYDMTQLENLGLTKDTNFTKPMLDEDSGRYTFTPAKYYLRKFKTPALRNIAKTAPYMHNGAFPDLKSVLDFYNKGGGEGLGLNVPNQTLSSKPLELTDSEMKDIIAFLNSLTDTEKSISKIFSDRKVSGK